MAPGGWSQLVLGGLGLELGVALGSGLGLGVQMVPSGCPQNSFGESTRLFLWVHRAPSGGPNGSLWGSTRLFWVHKAPSWAVPNVVPKAVLQAGLRAGLRVWVGGNHDFAGLRVGLVATMISVLSAFVF